MHISEQGKKKIDFFLVEIYPQVNKTEGDVQEVGKCSINTTV